MNMFSSSFDIINSKSSEEAPIALYNLTENASFVKEPAISFKNIKYSASWLVLLNVKRDATIAFVNAPYLLRL